MHAVKQLREQGEILSGPFKRQEGMRIDEKRTVKRGNH